MKRLIGEEWWGEGVSLIASERLICFNAAGDFIVKPICIYFTCLLPPPPKVDGDLCFDSCLFVTCEIEDSQVYWLVWSVILSVCLFVCQSPAGHILTPIFTNPHHLVEEVPSWKPIVFQVNRWKYQNTRSYKLWIFTRFT